MMGDARRRRQMMREVLDAIASLPEGTVVEARDEELQFVAGSTSDRRDPVMVKTVQTGPRVEMVRQKVTHAELTEMEKEARLNTQWADGLADVRHKRFRASLARHGKLT